MTDHYEIQNAYLRACIALAGRPEDAEAKEEADFALRDWDDFCRIQDQKKGGWIGR